MGETPSGTLRFKKIDGSFWNGETFRFADYTFTPFERELIEDLFFHNLSFRKAAEKRNISKSTCFKLCKKLLEKLQRLLKERGIDITFLKDDE